MGFGGSGLVTQEISASAVAWYGAIVATLSGAVLAYNILRDRARLLITVTPNMQFLNPDEPCESGTFTLVKVVNCGRRPITITHVWFDGGRKANSLLLADSFKHGVRELTEGQGADFPCREDRLAGKLIKYVCVNDSAGRKHRKKIPRAVIRTMTRARDTEAQTKS